MTLGGTLHTRHARLTGAIRLRASWWFGRPVAQVEVEYETRRMFGGETIAKWVTWRDAKRADILTTTGEELR